MSHNSRGVARGTDVAIFSPVTTLVKYTAWLLTLVILVPGCRRTATSRAEDPPRQNADARSQPTSPPPRTVLIQLDGFAATWLERYLKERRFLPGQTPASASQVAAGGFARLAAGARARGLVPA